jgi:hypothetical protein
MVVRTDVGTSGWRVCRVRADSPVPASLPPAMTGLFEDWDAWLAEIGVPV